MTRAAIALLAVLAAGCSSYAPQPMFANDVCFRCRRPIGEVRLAGQIIDSSGRAFKFKTPGCMAKFINEQPTDAAAIFVTDFRSGRIIKAAAATFVPATVGEGKNRGQDYLAFRSADAAQDAATREKTKPVTWNDVLAAAKTSNP